MAAVALRVDTAKPWAPVMVALMCRTGGSHARAVRAQLQALKSHTHGMYAPSFDLQTVVAKRQGEE